MTKTARAARRRLQRMLDEWFTPDSTTWLEVGRDAKLRIADLRAVLAEAERCEELERRIREVVDRAHEGGTPPLDSAWLDAEQVAELRAALSPRQRSRGKASKRGANTE